MINDCQLEVIVMGLLGDKFHGLTLRGNGGMGKKTCPWFSPEGSVPWRRELLFTSWADREVAE